MIQELFRHRSRPILIALISAFALACDVSSLISLASSNGNIITNAVTAKDVTGDTFEPSGITDTFPANQSILHAIVTIKDAPKNTAVKAAWLRPDNSNMGEYEIKSDGSRNLDFTFKPERGGLPPGNYQVEISLNGKVDRTLKFTVAGQAAQPTGGSCPPPPAVQTTAPGFPLKITMAENTQGDTKDPVGATTAFKSDSIFHAVVHIDNAPNATKFGAAWFASDTGGIAACNSAIDATTLEAGGTRNLDFTLAPTGKWPAGTFQVQIIVNGKVAAVQNFSVK